MDMNFSLTSVFHARDLNTRENSLNLMRLLLALLVVFSHAQILTGVGDGVVWQGQHLGSWAVIGFFAISGYLITGSRQRADGGQYLLHRVVRIFPAYLFVLVFVALGLAPIAHIIEKGTIDGFFGTSPTPINYIFSNILLHIDHYDVGGTLSTVPYPAAWNGSLWSLWYEFWCYIIIGVFMAWKYPRHRVWPTAALFVLSVLVHAFIDKLGPYMDNNADLRLLIWMFPYFMGGALIYQLRDKLPMRPLFALIALVAGLVLIYASDSAGKQAASPFIAYIVLFLGSYLPSPKVTQVHDISYGVYIFHFPVIQFLILLGMMDFGFPVLLATATAITFVLSTLSWLGIERATMRWSRGKRPWADITMTSH